MITFESSPRGFKHARFYQPSADIPRGTFVARRTNGVQVEGEWNIRGEQLASGFVETELSLRETGAHRLDSIEYARVCVSVKSKLRANKFASRAR